MRTWRSPYPPTGSFVAALRNLLQSELVAIDPEESGPAPSPKQLSVLLNTAFWATLRSEEGRHAPVAVAMTKEDGYSPRAIFQRPVDYSVDTLVKLSPVLYERSICLGVQPIGRNADLKCWGICHEPSRSLALRSEGPGQLLVSIGGEVVADVLPGQRPRVLGPNVLPWDWRISEFLRGHVSNEESFSIAWNLRFLAEAMQHGRGGTILLVPESSNAWKDSLDVKYKFSKDALNLESAHGRWSRESEEDKQRRERDRPELGPLLVLMTKGTPAERSFKSIARTIGGLTAVDGATVLSTSFTLIGFGAKILSRSDPPARILRLNPLRSIEDELASGDDFTEINLSATGGMRHRSAIQFVHDNPDAFALVASQDGGLTLFKSDAHRVFAVPCESLMPLSE